MSNNSLGCNTSGALDMRRLLLALAAGAGIGGAAQAVEIISDNPDISMRWDNTVRYNLGVRAEQRTAIGNNPNFDEGEYKFKRGDIVANRLDLLSEFDFTWRQQYGFRVSATGWYDNAYSNTSSIRNPSLPASIAGSYIGDQYSDYTKRYYRGPSGEWLDAFIFGTFDIGGSPLAVKLGRHTVYWGESLFSAVHGINYSQAPLDLAKGFATPGVEAKELFRPLTQLSAQLVASNDLTFGAQYFLDWGASRIPEGGTYLGPADFLLYGSDRASATLINTHAREPKKAGDWGVNARWSPAWLDGTAGLYYRRVTDKIPAMLVTGGTRYGDYFGEGINLYGLSLAKQIGDLSVGMEASYRTNMPLLAQTLGFAGGAPALIPVLFPHGEPGLIGNSYQARGNTFHALLNAVGVIGNTPLFDAANWAAELSYVRLNKVTANQDMYFGLGYGVCDADRQAALGTRFKNKWDGCATRDSTGLAINFTPSWLQVFPGVDVLAPLSYSRTLRGNAPVQLGGNEDNGSYSVGLAFDIDAKYRIDIKYVDYFGRTAEGPGVVPGTTQVTSANGLSTLLKDRGFVAMTLKTTF